MEHSFNISTDCNGMLVESEENSKQRGSECWTKQKTFVQILSHILKGAVKYDPGLAVMFNDVMWEIPDFFRLVDPAPPSCPTFGLRHSA